MRIKCADWTHRYVPEPCHWNSSTIVHVLGLQKYCGDVINFKTYSKSYKNKKRIENAPENMTIFRDVHEAVINRAGGESPLTFRACNLTVTFYFTRAFGLYYCEIN
jgi:hypothetical protein